MKELGKGAFGTVYKGRLKGTEGPWRAIKKIPKAAIKDSTMLLNEIEISMTLDNPNIVKLYEIYEFNQAIYLVGEY
jgi:serine/threonine protein kinase